MISCFANRSLSVESALGARALDLHAHSPVDKLSAHTSSNDSRSTSSNSFQAYSQGDEDEAPTDFHRVQQASSFDVEQMLHMRECTFRDSLMPGGAHNSNQDSHSGGHPTELDNALVRLDDSYRRAYNSNPRPSMTASGPTPDGITPLLQAARAGDIVLVNALVIQAGTDILRRDPMFGQTELHFSIRGGHTNVVQALLMPQLRGSIVNVADNRRNTALHLAAAKSRHMLKLLLECGADEPANARRL